MPLTRRATWSEQEQRRLVGPVQVVEHDHERADARRGGEERVATPSNRRWRSASPSRDGKHGELRDAGRAAPGTIVATSAQPAAGSSSWPSMESSRTNDRSASTKGRYGTPMLALVGVAPQHLARRGPRRRPRAPRRCGSCRCRAHPRPSRSACGPRGRRRTPRGASRARRDAADEPAPIGQRAPGGTRPTVSTGAAGDRRPTSSAGPSAAPGARAPRPRRRAGPPGPSRGARSTSASTATGTSSLWKRGEIGGGVEVLADDRHHVVAEERWAAAEHLVEHRAERVEIRAWVRLATERLLGGEIGDGAEHRALAGDATRFHVRGQARSRRGVPRRRRRARRSPA